MIDEDDRSGIDPGESGPSNGGGSNEDGAMLARTWTIAANFRKPADYGIPYAPTFPAECHSDGTLALFRDADSTEPFAIASNGMKVRR